MIRNSRLAKISSRLLLAIFYITTTVASVLSVPFFEDKVDISDSSYIIYIASRVVISLLVFSINIMIMNLVSQGPVEMVPSKYKKLLRLLIYIITTLMLLSWGLFVSINTLAYLNPIIDKSGIMRILIETTTMSLIAGVSIGLLQYSISLPVRKRNEPK